MKSEAVFRRCSVKEVFLKISKDYQLKISVSESRESGKGDFLWILRNFANIYFVEHLWTHTFVKWSNENYFDINIFTKTTGDRVLWSTVVGLRAYSMDAYSFTSKGISHRYFLVKLMKFCRASVLHNTTYCWATASNFQQHFWRIACFINLVTPSCLGTSDIATCKWSTLLALKMFKGNEKNSSRVRFWGWGRPSKQKNM